MVGGDGYFGVILVRVCEPVFQNLPYSYTWPLKKTDPFIYRINPPIRRFVYKTGAVFGPFPGRILLLLNYKTG